MKISFTLRTTSLSILAILVFNQFVFSQNVLSYDFRNNLNEVNGQAPALNVLGSGSYTDESLPDLSCMVRTVYSFTQNSGVQFDNGAAGSFINTTYSLEAYFKFVNNTGFIRLIDYKNRTSDYGVYATSTEFIFYDEVTVNTNLFQPDEYIHMVLTRNGNTQDVNMYLNGMLMASFNDVNGSALTDNSNVINFFQDDLVFGNEAQPGNIALLKVYDYALDSVSVIDKYNSLKQSTGTMAFSADNYSSCFSGNNFNFTNESLPAGLVNYIWDFGDGTLGSGISVSHSYAAPGLYDVALIGNDGLGCIDTIINYVEVFTSIPVSLGPDFGICDGDFALLDPGPGYVSYLWSDGSMNQTLAVSTPGSYSVDVTDSSGCSGSDSIVIFNIPSPVFTLGNDTTICFGTTLLLSAPLGLETYLWSTGLTTESITVSASGTYSVEVSNLDGCIAADTIVVVENPQVLISIGNDTTICDGQTLTLDPGPGYQNYQWNTSAITQTIDIVAAGQYIVTVTDSVGCSGTDDINIGVNPAPVVDIGPDVTICGGTQLILDAGPGFLTYLWSDGSQAQTLSINAGGTYTVTVGDGSGCDGMDEIIVTADPFVTLGADIYLCNGDSVTLDPGPGYSSYLWNTGSSAQAITALTPGVYTVTVTDINGCINSADIEVFIVPNPVPALGPDFDICNGDTTTLDAGAGFAAYIWNTGITTQTLDVFNAGTYTVTVTDNNGCVGSGAINIGIAAPPLVDLGPDFSFCSGTATILDAGAGASSYLWNDGSTSQLLLVIASGTYTVTVTNAAGCTNTDEVIVGMLNSPVVNLGPDTILCDGDSLLLDAGAGLLSYQWNNGSTTQTYYATASGPHSVTVTDSNGCTGTDDIQVDFYLPVPVPVISQNGNTLQSSSPTGNQWYSSTGGLIAGATGNTYNPPADGLYYVIVTDANGCMSAPSANFNFVMSGIAQTGSLQFSIYPNPTTGIIRIVPATGSDPQLTVQVADIAGKVVYNGKHNNSGTIILDLSSLEDGIYFVNMISNTSYGLKRIMIVR